MADKRKLRCFIQYNCIPHYRSALFKLLSDNDDIDFIIIADSKSDTPYMKSLPTENNGIMSINCPVMEFKIFGKKIFWQPGLIRLIKTEKPDVIITMAIPYSLTVWAMALYAKMAKIPVLFWGHGVLQNEYGLKNYFRMNFLKLASGHLLYGDYAKNILASKGFDGQKLFVVYNSLDFDLQKKVLSSITNNDRAEIRKSLTSSSDEKLVVFTGRLQYIKRLDLLIEAMTILKNKGVVVNAAIIGEGEERENLKKYAISSGVEQQVHFLGELYDENYLGLVISTSDVCVIPSGAGLSVMHALAYGTPVILHDNYGEHGPEWEAVENGYNGLYYKFGDVKDLASKIEQVLLLKDQNKLSSDDCLSVINDKYNPKSQADAFVYAVKSIVN